MILTTVGRVFFNEIWPEGMGFVNRGVDKGFLGTLIWHCYHVGGHDVTVYNRTLEKARPLEKKGARLAATPREAVEGADAIISIVLDDKASREIYSWYKEISRPYGTEMTIHNGIIEVKL